ncbi:MULTISPECIES: hypothetical protein [Asticcacaulis]|uniref:hypothetical protein n=1 Tax=Asticcacaulis TaxID=76890 RepID=UPI001AE948AB|nr:MULTISPECIES: hypothetical protein [Asticcacaulis]MBP2159089.1 hypothetical protein [Asticcacaulis solisilvae]MDR6800134.1 hypothetical protein [Asticcacaulis sp. BE141]
MAELHAQLSNDDIRIVQAIADFQMALSAMIFLDEADANAKISRVERRRLRCFEDAAVVAYNRPFTSSKGLPKLSFEMIGIDPEPSESELHQRLRVRRDKVVGHTDISEMRLALSTFRAFDDREVMMPLMDFDDALAFFVDRAPVIAWVRKLRSAASEMVFSRVQGVPDIKFVKDHTLPEETDAT